AVRALGWLGAVWLNSGVRLVLYWRFKQRRRSNDELGRWQWLMVAAMGVAGSVYGSIILLPGHEPSLLYLAVTSVAVTGHVAAGTQALVALPRVLVISVGTVLTPLIWVSATSSSTDVQLFNIMYATYLVGVLAMSRQNYQTLRTSLRLRYENLDLAKSLAQRNATEAAARAEAEATGRDKTRFLAAASHDLRQPMHALAMFVSALKAEPLAARSEHLVGRIDSTVQALQQQLDSLLDISRLDAGGIAAQARALDVRSLARQIETVFATMAQQKGLRLRLMAPPLGLMTDPDMVAQVVRNLVANAIRYTTRGSVVVAFRRRGDYVRIQVWDTGVGIPVDQYAAIFREFHQLGNPQRDRTQGVGLGLAIVERLARLLQTHVEVRSQLGRGSVFWFDIPAADNASAVPRTARPTAPPFPAQASDHQEISLTILIIDDDALVRESMSLLLQSWGHQVVQAMDLGTSVAAITQHDRFDIIITDFRLPQQQTAFDVINALAAARSPLPPVLVITGETAPAQIRLIHGSGYRVLHKPVVPAVLRQALVQLNATTMPTPAPASTDATAS
nr:hybrid sensor histidine kinase/response regulator [Kofleriaceae bacterium]